MKIRSTTINKKIKRYTLFGSLMVLTLMRYGFQINIPQELLLLVTAIIACLGDNDDIIAMILCCIPLYSSFDYLYAVLIGSVVFAVKNATEIKIDFLTIPVLSILVWELLHSFVAGLDIRQITIMFIPYLLIWILYSYKGKRIDYDFVVGIFSFFVGGVGITLLLRVVLASGMNFMNAISKMRRLGLVEETSEVVGGVINPNSFGIMCVLAIAGLLQKHLYGKKKWIGILGIILLILLGVLTQSRTYIVCLVFMFALFVFDKKKSFKESISTLAKIVVSIFGGILVLLILFPTAIGNFISRWQVKDISNGRLDILTSSMDYIWSNLEVLLFGIGSQNFTEKATKMISVAPHDAINEIIMAWGIPGFIIFCSFLFFLIKGAKKKNPHMRLVNYIPFLIIVMKALAGHWITSGYTMLATAFAYLSMCHDFTNGSMENGFCKKRNHYASTYRRG